MIRGLLRGVIVAAALSLVSATAPAEAEPASALFKGFRSTSKDPINVDAQALEISEEDKQRVSVFSGGVTIRRGDTILKATTVKLFEDLDAADQGQPVQPHRGGGQGHRHVRQPGRHRQQCRLQHPRQYHRPGRQRRPPPGHQQITGDRLIIDLATGVARIEQAKGGQIKGRFHAGQPRRPGPARRLSLDFGAAAAYLGSSKGRERAIERPQLSSVASPVTAPPPATAIRPATTRTRRRRG